MSCWTRLAAGALLLPGAVRASAQISFYTAVDLAVRNSNEVRMAQADVTRAAAGLSQTRDAYLPSLALGSSVGYSYGFPVGQPSVYNVSGQSLVFSFSQPDYIRSARASLLSARDALKDTKQKVIQEVASDYIELDAEQQELSATEQQHEYGQKLIDIERDRVLAGVDSQMEETHAELRNAQLELHRIHLRTHTAQLAARIAHLAGLPEDGVSTVAQSIPNAPDFNSDTFTQTSAKQAAAANYGLRASDAAARSKFFVARGDERQNYRPEVAFGIQYSRYAKFNNYAEYYLRFQHNNFDVGINVTMPLFDAIRRDKARASAADAVHAQAQADQVRLQFSEQLGQLRGGLDELAVQQKVARLQNDYAREQLQAVITQIENGSGAPGAAPLTPRDEELAKIEERQRYTEMLQANLQLAQAQINLLRALGRIEDWARQTPQPAAGASSSASVQPRP